MGRPFTCCKQHCIGDIISNPSLADHTATRGNSRRNGTRAQGVCAKSTCGPQLQLVGVNHIRPVGEQPHIHRLIQALLFPALHWSEHSAPEEEDQVSEEQHSLLILVGSKIYWLTLLGKLQQMIGWINPCFGCLIPPYPSGHYPREINKPHQAIDVHATPCKPCKFQLTCNMGYPQLYMRHIPSGKR